MLGGGSSLQATMRPVGRVMGWSGPVPHPLGGVTVGRLSPSSALDGRSDGADHHTGFPRMAGRSFSEHPEVELPGVEPGSRDPEALGSTCVGSGCSRARCSGARQPPCPIPPFGVPLGPVVMSAGLSLVMSIRPSYEASEADRRRCLSCDGNLKVLVGCCFPRVISEVAWAPSARSHGNGQITIETVSAPGRCASSLWSCQPARWGSPVETPQGRTPCPRRGLSA